MPPRTYIHTSWRYAAYCSSHQTAPAYGWLHHGNQHVYHTPISTCSLSNATQYLGPPPVTPVPTPTLLPLGLPSSVTPSAHSELPTLHPPLLPMANTSNEPVRQLAPARLAARRARPGPSQLVVARCLAGHGHCPPENFHRGACGWRRARARELWVCAFECAFGASLQITNSKTPNPGMASASAGQPPARRAAPDHRQGQCEDVLGGDGPIETLKDALRVDFSLRSSRPSRAGQQDPGTAVQRGTGSWAVSSGQVEPWSRQVNRSLWVRTKRGHHRRW